ncbi:MAG: hypothetical protein LQ352_003141 [Teloschistes flavicans]|nr:MAG: hypothetical protein LQ352_003141 [Teloschistes flavicans]
MAGEVRDKPSVQATTTVFPSNPATELSEDGDYLDIGVGEQRPGYTKVDRKDMYRMGKRQELMRNFSPVSALSFTALLQATWEANTQGLVDGGLAGLFWSYIWTFFGSGIIMLSLAEMASMCPTSGGQYHWVSEFAPPKYQRFLSYMTGWVSTLSWQAGAASGSFLTGTIIQGLLTVNDPNYSPTNWQGTLFVFAMVLVLFVFNIWGAKALPVVQNALLGIHIIGWLVIIVVLWALAPKQSASGVFTQFTNGGGWSTMGLSLMVGQISAIFGSTCSDATAHMAEEVADAGRSVPIAIVWSYVLNGIMGFILLISYLFAIPSVDDALNDPSTYPFIYAFRSAVPTSGVNGLTSVVLILVIASNISFNAATSRQTWSFARDRGLPFSDWIGHVSPGKEIPANAVALTCLLSAVLSLINIGSSAAFNAIISLQVVALMFTYCISISCVMYRRIYHPETLPKARWSLGSWGLGINVAGLVYAFFAFFWCFWPNATPVDASSFNWAVVMFVGVIVLSLVMFLGSKGQVIVAGAIAGLISRFCIAPLDVLKIRLQLQTDPLWKGANGRVGTSNIGSGTIHTFKDILHKEGVTAFWKGNVPAELLYIAYGAVQFSAYRTTNQLLQPLKLPDPVDTFISGATAGAVATSLTYPLDLLRTRFAAQGSVRVYRNLRSSVLEIARTEGTGGFFQGIGPAVGQVVPYMGLFFSAYEFLRPTLADLSLPFGSGDASAGIIAGVLAKSGVFPLDLIRKRLQVQGPTRSRYVGGSIPVYKGVWATGKLIVGHEGWRGLYRGLGISLVKSAPASAVTMWTYEHALKILHSIEND